MGIMDSTCSAQLLAGGRRMPRTVGRVLATGLALVALAGCGASGGSDAAVGGSDRSDRTTTSDGSSELDACKTEQRTVRTAAEAYNALAGEYPTSIDQLTKSGTAPDGTRVEVLLEREPRYWDLAPSDDGRVTAKAGVDLPDGCGDGSVVPTTEASGGDPGSEADACKAEKRAVRTAAEAYNAMTGAYPTSMVQLTRDGTAPDGYRVNAMLRQEPVYWDLAPAADGTVTPKSGVDLPDGCR